MAGLHPSSAAPASSQSRGLAHQEALAVRSGLGSKSASCGAARETCRYRLRTARVRLIRMRSSAGSPQERSVHTPRRKTCAGIRPGGVQGNGIPIGDLPEVTAARARSPYVDRVRQSEHSHELEFPFAVRTEGNTRPVRRPGRQACSARTARERLGRVAIPAGSDEELPIFFAAPHLNGFPVDYSSIGHG
jgi:hypothetical protein